MRTSKYKYLERIDKNNIDQYKENKKYFRHDDFTTPWIVFMTLYPLPRNLQRVFNKMETSQERIGVLSKWLIKVAKKQGVSQSLIDMYCEVKRDKKIWYEWYGEQIEKATESVKNEEDFNDMMTIYRATKNATKYEERQRALRFDLNDVTLKLLYEVMI